MNIKKTVRKFNAILKELRIKPSKNIFDGKVEFYMVDPQTIQNLEFAIKTLESEISSKKNQKIS